ncbi:MAG: hypothetical protein JOZ05_02750, partial [Acetobacteraceae bacterium]|nr:hypothetical protein [Acetobacteraceae bacterium]
MPSDSLAGLDLPASLPRRLVAIIGENENGALRALSQSYLDVATPYGFTGEIIDLREDNWSDRLREQLQQGLLLAWGQAGVGARITHGDRLIWDTARVPFISVMADSPCQKPMNHRVEGLFVANGYLVPDWLNMQRRFVRSPQLSSLLPHGMTGNPRRDAIPWSQRQYRMVLVKTGHSPEQHRREWASWPSRFRAVVEDTAAAALRAGVGDITDLFLAAAEHHGLVLDGRTDVLFGLLYAADLYIRDFRSTALVKALLDLPVDIIGRGWDHVKEGPHRARFHPPLGADTIPLLYANSQFVLNTMPNFSHGTHDRVLYGFAARSCVVTNENADMRERFGALPTYFG